MRDNYKVLLVEPKKTMIYIFKNMLPWEKYQFEITTEAEDEATAIAYYGEYHHDLVICDLDLNGGDGLSLIKNLKGIREDCKIIVISNRMDYESVRQAFRNGAYDYLLKSKLSFQDFENLLLELKKVLNNSIQADDWRIKLENLLGLIRDHQIVNEQAVNELLMQPELDVLNQSYQIIFFRMDNVHQVNLGMRKYDNLEDPRGDKSGEFSEKYKKKLELRRELQKNTQEVVAKVFADIPQHCLVFTKKHSGMILVPVMDQKTLLDKIKFLSYSLSEVCFYSYSFTLSSVYYGRASFLQAYQDVMNYHRWMFYKGDGCILDATENKTFKPLELALEPYYNQICMNLIALRLDEIENVFHELSNYFETKEIAINEIYDAMIQMFNEIESFMSNKGINDPRRFDYYRSGILECDTLVMMESEIERIFKSFFIYIQKQNIQQYSKEVNDLILYIHNNLHRHLTLAMISDISGYSEIHTSRIFKKEVGVGIIHYINEKKMLKAKELLASTTLKIKDVAAAVGISDQLYFNKQFNKQFNMSPSQFRKQIKTNKDI